MTFDSVEQSVQSGTPRELYDFVAPTKTWRLCTGDNDIVFNGNLYTATAGSRSNLTIVSSTDTAGDLTITIPASHDFAKSYVAGLPPREVLVTLTRYHPSSGVFSQLWQGYATGLAFQLVEEGAAALVQVPDLLTTALACDVGSVIASRVCNHVLGDPQCTVNLASFTVTTTITAISADGRTITTAASVPAAVSSVDWSLHGALKHVASGESRTIVQQYALNQFLLQAPMPNGVLAVGTSVSIVAGCNKSLSQACAPKFTNAINFGGLPLLPQSNIFYVGLVNAHYKQFNSTP